MSKADYQKLLFKVEKKKTSELTGLTTLASRHSHATVMTEPDSGIEQVIAFVGPDYELVRNEDILIPLHEALKDDYKLEIKTSHRNYSQFEATFTVKDKSLSIMKGDEIFPQVKIQNSYDGRLRLKIKAGYYRLICSNGLTAPVGEEREMDSIHTASIKELVDQFVGFIGEFINISKSTAEIYKPLVDIKIDELMVEELINDITKGTKFPKRQIETAIDIMNFEAEQLKVKPNGWLLYNGLNNVIYDDDHGLDMTKADKADAMILDKLLLL
tara:strand:+ start:305 stop:1117 length:813 start_codon:yes stop_codon:yes gene_type:complete